MSETNLGKSAIWTAPYGESPNTAKSIGAFEVDIQGGASKSTPTMARPLRISLSVTLATSTGAMRTVTSASATKLGTLVLPTAEQAVPKVWPSNWTIPTGSLSSEKVDDVPGVKLKSRV